MLAFVDSIAEWHLEFVERLFCASARLPVHRLCSKEVDSLAPPRSDNNFGVHDMFLGLLHT